ncbi:uncharacterized protein ARMOST_16429 [Armillaria ostoyae]|uniref:Uncharacterized protein n=1 Tax=Armillaria ostoyae TaxID=47428 RepID=A0A284RW69_ARMOS|nr:uncharacterized protein ARMOST_16429 [Armillaria ostoyae]
MVTTHSGLAFHFGEPTRLARVLQVISGKHEDGHQSEGWCYRLGTCAARTSDIRVTVVQTGY